MRFLVILSVFLLTQTALLAQTGTKEQLALQYFNTGDYEKASGLFEELFNSNMSSDYYYKYYIECLFKIKDYKKAESIIRKQIRRSPEKPNFSVDLGYLYGLLNDEKKKNKTFNDLIKDMKSEVVYISLLSNSFIQRNELNYAIQCYQKGRNLLADPILFAFPLADLYKNIKQFSQMLDEYILILNNEPNQLEIVQNYLQDEVLNEDIYNLTRDKLVNEIQKTDYNPDMIDLLIWLFVQKRDFNSAFIQVKALDKRLNDNNTRLVQLAQLCISNRDYSVADQIYQYILTKGEATPYFYHAKFGLIEVKYLKISASPKPSLNDLTEIENLYTDFLNNSFYRFIDISEKVILRLAEIKAVYLGKTTEAINLLEKYMNVPQITRNTQAYMKLALADYYVLDGNVWDAILLYLQVNKMFTDHPIGHEAKFRNARLSFFMGNFDWATDQLEVLKGSTSELISNDALRLSLLIQDVLGIDSNETPLQMYARADFFMFKHQYDSALIVFDSIINNFSKVFHPLIDDAWFAKALIAEKKQEYEKSLDYYANVYTEFKDGIIADAALFNAALVTEELLSDFEKAKELYQKLLLDYPDSVYVVDARKRFRKLRGETNI